MESKELLLKSLNESQGFINQSLDGLTKEELARAPGEGCNSIIFLYWHLARVEDLWINHVLRQSGEIYDEQGWQEKLGTPPEDTGFRYTPEQLESWCPPDMDTLRGYAAAVREKTLVYLETVTPASLSAEVSRGRFSGTVGTALAHLVTEIALHAGQMAYLHGMVKGMAAEYKRYW